MSREVFESLNILKIEIIPGTIKIFRVHTPGGVVDVDAATLTSFPLFNRASVNQTNQMYPFMRDEPWSLKVHKALRNTPEPAVLAIEQRHIHGTDSWPAETVPWLINNRIPELGYGLMVGPTSAYKSFLFLELVGCLITPGMRFLKERIVHHGGVLILSPEGAPDIPQRWAAWIRNRMTPDLFRPGVKLPFAFIGSCRPLINPRTVDWVVEEAQFFNRYFQEEYGVNLVMIGIDTLSKAAGWENESEAAPVQITLNHMDEISSATKTFVLAADHFGKDESLGPRGSYVKMASPPTLLYVHKEPHPHVVLHKSRSGVQGLVFPFEMKSVKMGTDRWGQEQTSLVVNWELTQEQLQERTRARRPTGRPSEARPVLDQALTESFAAHTEQVQVNGEMYDAIRLGNLRVTFRRLFLLDKPDATQKAINKALNRALDDAGGTLGRKEVDGDEFLWRNPVRSSTEIRVRVSDP